ncbi:hypothetical protein VIBRN418_08272 [Vibrio sp. N418]|uniref:hypothetical protein n=1 Tax=Vibrio sp. (strain N418) TaxID=701176 RepID=UPI00021BFA18|nr:hypothetical protein [Vibrio sp. N418]EGU37331.1 hypothetical protein VIBRN418_08272 [Vibrio sp. N418]
MGWNIVEWAEKVAVYFESGNYVGVLFLVAVSVLINLSQITTFYSTHKKRRLGTLSDLKNLDGIDDRLKKLIESEINVEVFYLTHKLKLSSLLINGVLALNERIGEHVSFSHILRCSRLAPDLTGLDELSFRIKVKKRDYVYAVYNGVLGMTGFLLGFIGFTYSVATITHSSNFDVLFISGLILLVSIGMLSQTTPVVSTRIINKELERLDVVTLETEEKSL